MMNWFKSAQNKVTKNELNKQLKSLIKSHPFFIRLMAKYKIPQNEVDNIEFSVKDLGERHAEADATTITFNSNLFTEGDFFKDKLFYFVHEFYHWVRRRAEKQFYFNDPEEIESFALSIAWEIIGGKDRATIEHSIFPIIQGHFTDANQAKSLFSQMYEQAESIAGLYT